MSEQSKQVNQWYIAGEYIYIYDNDNAIHNVQ